MEGSNVVDWEVAERDRGICMCKGGTTLSILKDVQKAYEQRLEVVGKVGGHKKLQMEVEVLRSWVGDLVSQNALLARAIEELETETTAKLMLERTRHNEVELELRGEVGALRRRLARKDSDLRGLVEVLRRLREFDYCTLEGIHFFEVTESDIFGNVKWRQQKLEQGDMKRNNVKQESHKRDKKKIQCSAVKGLMSVNDSLQKENLSKDREIRRLNKDVNQYEQVILNLRKEVSMKNCNAVQCPKKDAEVMVDTCCKNRSGCVVEVNYGAMLKDEAAKYQERMLTKEGNLKSADENTMTLRKVNVALSEELHALRRVCAALDEQCRAASLRAQFKDEIICEMRRQLKQAKAKLRESERPSKDQKDYMDGDKTRSPSCLGLRAACVRQQPRRKRESLSPEAPLHPESDYTSPRFDGSGDDRL